MVYEVIQCSARTVHGPEALSLGSAIDRKERIFMGMDGSWGGSSCGKSEGQKCRQKRVSHGASGWGVCGRER